MRPLSNRSKDLSGPYRLFLGTPHPYSVSKFLRFIGLERGYRCKVLSAKNLAAESSWVRTYGLFCLDFPRIWRIYPRTAFLHFSYCAPAAVNDSQNCAKNLSPKQNQGRGDPGSPPHGLRPVRGDPGFSCSRRLELVVSGHSISGFAIAKFLKIAVSVDHRSHWDHVCAGSDTR